LAQAILAPVLPQGGDPCGFLLPVRGAAMCDAHADGGIADLMRHEEELTREVPALLDTMNRSSEEVNQLESQVSTAQERYKKMLVQWSRQFEQLRLQHGNAIERVKPYFDAVQVLRNASQRVQSAVRDFSAASSQHTQSKRDLRAIEEELAYGAHRVQLDGSQQDGLSRATVRVLTCQQERDRCETDYARSLREYQEAQEKTEVLRTQIGSATIKRTMPCFKQLQSFHHTLATEQHMIQGLTERAKTAKASYHSTLRELDRISNAVHTARQLHSSKALQVTTRAAGKEHDMAEADVPEETPETTPEATEVPEVSTRVEEEKHKAISSFCAPNCTCSACSTFGSSPQSSVTGTAKDARSKLSLAEATDDSPFA